MAGKPFNLPVIRDKGEDKNIRALFLQKIKYFKINYFVEVVSYVISPQQSAINFVGFSKHQTISVYFFLRNRHFKCIYMLLP